MDDVAHAHIYRLQKMNEILGEIESERQMRLALSKKYNQAFKAIEVTNSVLVWLSTGLAVAGIGVLSTIAAAPVAIALHGISAAACLLLIAGKPVSKKLALKAEKHEKIKELADAKLNLINKHISKAVEDGYISDEEYLNVLSELEAFNQLKAEIRSKIQTDKNH